VTISISSSLGSSWKFGEDSDAGFAFGEQSANPKPGMSPKNNPFILNIETPDLLLKIKIQI